MNLPSASDVMNSVTRDQFKLRNWQKHKDDDRYPPGGYPFWADYAAYDGQRFTRRDVFDHFSQSTVKGIISAIKWGYPSGGRPGGVWQAFSSAFRETRLAEAVEEIGKSPPQPAHLVVSRLNAVVSGIGTSTTTKIAYFAGLKAQATNGLSLGCLIYDQMVRRAIRDPEGLAKEGSYPEFDSLKRRLGSKSITPAKERATYGLYLEAVTSAAQRLKVDPNLGPAQIELFLFNVGRDLTRRRRAA